jgi:hypothetical protein
MNFILEGIVIAIKFIYTPPKRNSTGMVHVIRRLLKGFTFPPEKMNDWKTIHPTRILTILRNFSRIQQQIMSCSPEKKINEYNKTINYTLHIILVYF